MDNLSTNLSTCLFVEKVEKWLKIRLFYKFYPHFYKGLDKNQKKLSTFFVEKKFLSKLKIMLLLLRM